MDAAFRRFKCPSGISSTSFVLPDGRVVATGSFEAAIATQVLDINTQTWSVVDPVVVDGHSSVMYGLNKFMKSGTVQRLMEVPPYRLRQPLMCSI